MCGWVSHTHYWGPGPQPRHVPWLGIEPVALWFTGQHSTTEPHQPGQNLSLKVLHNPLFPLSSNSSHIAIPLGHSTLTTLTLFQSFLIFWLLHFLFPLSRTFTAASSVQHPHLSLDNVYPLGLSSDVPFSERPSLITYLPYPSSVTLSSSPPHLFPSWQNLCTYLLICLFIYMTNFLYLLNVNVKNTDFVYLI